MTTRERFAFISAITSTLGSGVAAIVLGIFLLESLFPTYAQPTEFHLGAVTLGVFVLILLLICGMLVGALLWLFIMKRWYSRKELAPYFVQPDILIVTPILSWLFLMVYQNET